MEKESRARELWEEVLEGLAPATKRQYLLVMDRFLKFAKIETCEDLYQEKLVDSASGDPRDATKIESLVKKFLRGESNRGVKAGTVRNSFRAIQSFFKSQNTSLKMTNSDLPQEDSLGRELVNKEQILALYDSVGSENKLRNRALALFLAQSGLRIGDALALNVEAFTEARRLEYEDETFLILDPSLTSKCGVYAFITLGFEAVKAIEAYLASKDDLKPDSPLFMDDRNGKRLGTTAGVEIFRRLATHIPNGKRIGAHSFRKFFITSLQGSNVPESWIKIMCGKKVGGSMGEYSKPQEKLAKNPVFPNALIESYVTHYDALRVFGEGKREEKEKIKSEIIEELKRSNIGVKDFERLTSKVMSLETDHLNLDKVTQLQKQNQLLQDRIKELESQQITEEGVKDMIQKILDKQREKSVALEIKKGTKRADIVISQTQ